MSHKIKIPTKLSCKKNETYRDINETLTFCRDCAKSMNKSSSIYVSSNDIPEPKQILNNIVPIGQSIINNQKANGIEEDALGKKLYAVIYSWDKAIDHVNKSDVISMNQQFTDIYSDYQSISLITENREKIYEIVIFNNYSANSKMTKGFRPQHMTNIYNNHLNNINIT